MKADTRLDSAVFQLTPTRTRCELVISAGGETEKLASGLLNPFLSHLKAAEEQIAKGGYSIKLEPPYGNNQRTSWFTKGTIERFVRFVSTPEVLERVNTIETEISQIEEAISVQCSEALVTEEQPSKSSSGEQNEVARPIVDEVSETAIVPYKSRRHSVDGNEAAHGENSKACLLRVLETRKNVLQKEQGMAFARAAAAGFDMEHMQDLVSFADCFGAFRIREACIHFMNLWKKKQEAGLWLEEMELETMEASSTRSEMALMNASGIMLASDSVVRRSRPKDFPDGSSDYPSEIGDTKFSSHDDLNNYEKSNATEARSNENRVSLEGQVPSPLAVGNGYPQGHLQQPMMSMWHGQVMQNMPNFQSHSIGPGPTMQGIHGFPMQGTPYYHGYPPNPPPFYQAMYPQSDDQRGMAMPVPNSYSHWPQYAEDPRSGTTQRTESHAFTNISPDTKRHALDERDNNLKSEASETGTPKSLSRSLDLADQDTESDQEKEHTEGKESHRHLQRRSTSPRRRSPSPRRKVKIGRAGHKQSGMLVIRNINYISSKKHDRTGKEDVSESSGSETDSDVEEKLKRQAEDVKLHVQDVIDLFEKKRRESAELSAKKAGRHSVESWNSGDSRGKSARDDADREADKRDDDNEGWSAFQKYLLRDDESSQNNTDSFDKADQGGRQNIMNVEDMIAVDRNESEGWKPYNGVSLEQELVSKKKEQGMTNDSFVLPKREGEGVLLGSKQMTESEGSSAFKRSTANDDFINSRAAGQTTSYGPGPDPFASGEFDHTTNWQSGYRYADKSPGQSIEDDSFMVSSRFISQSQIGNEWRTVMNIDSELPSAEKTESSNSLQKIQNETTDGFGRDELYMIPERISEGETLGVPWDPAMDYEMQANLTGKMHPGAELNGSLDKNKIPKGKADSKSKEHPKTKKTEKEMRLKAMQEALEKRKVEMASRNAKLGKPSPLAEAQMRAEKLRAFKASLQKAKKEMEEEERNRLEELKMQRQKRIAARRSSSPTSSSSTSRTVKSQHLKTGQASSLLSQSSQKVRNSRALSPGGSFPSPSNSRSITRSSSEISNDVRSGKPTLSRHTKSIGNPLSRSVPSLSELRKEPEGALQAGRRLSATRKSSDQILSPKTAKEGGTVKPNGSSKSTSRASDSQESKRGHLPAARKSVVTGTESKDKSLKGSSGSDASSHKIAKHTGMHATQRVKGIFSAADVGNVKSKKNAVADISKKLNDDVLSQAEKTPKSGEPDSLTTPRAEVAVESEVQESGSEKKAEVVSPGFDPVCASPSSNIRSVIQDPPGLLSDDGHAKHVQSVAIRAPINMVEENETEKACESDTIPVSSFAMHSPPHCTLSDVREDEGDILEATSSMLETSNTNLPYKAPYARITSFEDKSDNKSTYNAPLAPETTSASLGIFIPRAPASENNGSVPVTSDFPSSSPLLHTMSRLPQSISPATDSGKADVFHSYQKGSSGEKPKDNAKGFKRLLKFGRKNHNKSTTSDSYEEDHGGRLEETSYSTNMKSQISGLAKGGDNDISTQANSLGSLISQDDNNSEINAHKASRSFFSLPTFRSKGSETKSR